MQKFSLVISKDLFLANITKAYKMQSYGLASLFRKPAPEKKDKKMLKKK